MRRGRTANPRRRAAAEFGTAERQIPSPRPVPGPQPTMSAPAHRPTPRTDRPQGAPCIGPRDPDQAVVLREEDRPPDPTAMPRGRSPPRRQPYDGFRGTPPRVQRQDPDRIEPSRPTNDPAPCGERTIPQTVHSRMNAMDGSRACLFRRRAADPKAFCRDRRKMLAPTLSRTVFTSIWFY